ncbi:16S rRNA (guanine(527)-N(7))-methyltransferase RsmG [Paraferrimonas sp. SM1919]|uniref:16S rRNA (guanine(527)-N(7))-methyltransferase RsmG n=1 Tax=Paraferrimonas sp. SM1919 TaxID=2662263 RepID=UPI0013D4F83E|nr:16S rRNA (guanine(527)-N(7))-methyltransferase RsmG [Paraferrimonas sp. SM1919]
MLQQYLSDLLKQTDLIVTNEQQQKLIAFVELLHKWNKAYNLTSIRDPKQMLVRHVMDSICVSPHLQGHRFIDVGTGPGLPGIPLAIINPDKEFVLLDSLGKRTRFQKQVKFELGLQNIESVNSRVEDYHDEVGFDGVLSRAFASMSDMLQWCHHLPKETGQFVALKANIEQSELEQIPQQFAVQQIIELTVPELNEPRHVVKIK